MKNARGVIGRILAIGALIALGAALFLEIALLADLRSFELVYLFGLIGFGGLCILLVIQLALLTVGYLLFQVAAGAHVRVAPLTITALLAGGVSLLWLADWVLLEVPISVKLRNAVLTEDELNLADRAVTDFAVSSAGISPLTERADQQPNARLGTMASRIVINRPEVFTDQPLGDILLRNGERYGVDPILVFGWAYLDSFYGEATSGPIPFFKGMTAETFRDVVQLHLPWWFIESKIRLSLIEGTILETIAGPVIGHKLRYALQKATYDVSIDPFDTNVFSDGLLILTTFPEEFPEIETPATSLDEELRRTIEKLRETLPSETCWRPSDPQTRGNAYYSINRETLISFSRAFAYKMLFDFDFATRVQSLVAAYYSRRFEDSLGRETWANLSAHQRVALLAMLRDVYVPNIGRLSGNVYMLPEFNCAPFDFVSGEIRSVDWSSSPPLWLPSDTDALWAGATFKLRNLAEVWNAARPDAQFPLHPPTETVDAARLVIAANVDRLNRVNAVSTGDSD